MVIYVIICIVLLRVWLYTTDSSWDTDGASILLDPEKNPET